MNPPSPKRFRDISLFESATRTPRLSDSPLRLLQIVDKRLEKQTVEIQTQIQTQLQELFKESEARLLSQLEKRLCEKLSEMRLDIDDVRERVTNIEKEIVQNKIEIETKISELHKDITNVMEKTNNIKTVSSHDLELKSEVIQLRNKILQHENSAVACDLRIDGIPYNIKEDLYDMFNILCSNLHIGTPNVRAIYRLNNKNNPLAPTILVKLSSPYEKNFIIKTVSNYRRSTKDLLRLYLINFDANNPFYVNENLSHANYKIFNQALKMKREKVFCSVFTMRGIVHVIINERDQPLRIDYIDQLQEFFRENQNEVEMQH